MPLIMNASSQEHQVRVYGAYFTFAPGQMKMMDPEKVFFLASKHASLGFITLPEQFEDIEFKATPEGKKLLSELVAKGVDSRIQALQEAIQNERGALRKDMDRVNSKSGIEAEMSSESIAAMKAKAEELASYRRASKSKDIEKADQLKAIEKLLEE